MGRLEVAPPPPAAHVRLDPAPHPRQDIPVWDGTPFDIAYAIDALYILPRPSSSPLMRPS